MGTTDQGQRLMAAALEVAQHHNAAKVTDMQAIGSWVYAHVCCGYFLGKLFFSARHNLVEHTSPFKFFYKIHRIISFL